MLHARGQANLPKLPVLAAAMIGDQTNTDLSRLAGTLQTVQDRGLPKACVCHQQLHRRLLVVLVVVDQAGELGFGFRELVLGHQRHCPGTPRSGDDVHVLRPVHRVLGELRDDRLGHLLGLDRTPLTPERLRADRQSNRLGATQGCRVTSGCDRQCLLSFSQSVRRLP